MARNNEFEVRVYDLGTTSVRLLRVGNVIQMFFSNPKAAAIYYKKFDAIFKEHSEQ